MVRLISNDKQTFDVEPDVAAQSWTVKNTMDDMGPETEEIPLTNVNGSTLAKVIEYCKFIDDIERQKADQGVDLNQVNESARKWSNDFFTEMNQSKLFDVILAANYLNIKPLLDDSCQRVANSIKGKTVEEIRNMFHIKNDFTPEEEDEVRRENQWAFE